MSRRIDTSYLIIYVLLLLWNGFVLQRAVNFTIADFTPITINFAQGFVLSLVIEVATNRVFYTEERRVNLAPLIRFVFSIVIAVVTFVFA